MRQTYLSTIFWTHSQIYYTLIEAIIAIIQTSQFVFHLLCIVLEVSPDVMLCGIFKMAPRPLYHFTMCNPPFFGNIMEAQGIMTSRNVSRREPSSVSTAAECEMVWEEGGEVDFISRMITDSLQLREQVVWVDYNSWILIVWELAFFFALFVSLPSKTLKVTLLYFGCLGPNIGHTKKADCFYKLGYYQSHSNLFLPKNLAGKSKWLDVSTLVESFEILC